MGEHFDLQNLLKRSYSLGMHFWTIFLDFFSALRLISHWQSNFWVFHRFRKFKLVALQDFQPQKSLWQRGSLKQENQSEHSKNLKVFNVRVNSVNRNSLRNYQFIKLVAKLFWRALHRRKDSAVLKHIYTTWNKFDNLKSIPLSDLIHERRSLGSMTEVTAEWVQRRLSNRIPIRRMKIRIPRCSLTFSTK